MECEIPIKKRENFQFHQDKDDEKEQKILIAIDERVPNCMLLQMEKW